MLSRLKDARTRIAVKGPRYLQAIFKDPRWVATFVLGRFYFLRKLSRRLSTASKKVDYEPSTLFRGLDSTAILDELNRDGMCDAFRLPKETVEGIHRYAATATAVANEDPNSTFMMSKKSEFEAEIGKQVVVAKYPEIQQCLDANTVLNDPILNEVASNYLGSEVKASCRMWWSFPVDASREDRLRFAQGTFHYDPDVDFRALKFFFCLTDTDKSSGAHECVIGSHRRKSPRHLFTLFVGQTDKEIERYYGADKIRQMDCEAGQGFAEDPLCFHKGNAPTEKARLMLEVLFVPNRNTEKVPEVSCHPARKLVS